MAANVQRVSVIACSPRGRDEKVSLLRQYEADCYQIALYVLKDAKQASEAAKRALLTLYAQDEWYDLPEAERMGKVKHAAINQALEYRKQSIGGAPRAAQET